MNIKDNSYNYSINLTSGVKLLFAGCVLLLLLVSNCPVVNASGPELLLDRGYFPVVKSRICSADRSIRMIMYEADYYKKFKNSPSNQLIDALIAARMRGVTVQVILDVRDTPDRGTKTNLETGQRLKKSGIEVFVDTEKITTHCKFLVIDEKTVVIGSTNWTYSALTSNHEASIVLESGKISAGLIEYFDKIKKTSKKL